MSDARLSLLSVIRVHKHKEIDFNEFISEFAGKKDRRSVFVTETHSILLTFVKAIRSYILHSLRILVDRPA